MSTINSSSTDEDVLAAYDDNASYAEDASVTKAKAFITATRILLRRLPRMASKDGASLQMSPDLLQSEIADAQEFVDNNDTTTSTTSGPSVTRTSFENFRD